MDSLNLPNVYVTRGEEGERNNNDNKKMFKETMLKYFAKW